MGARWHHLAIFAACIIIAAWLCIPRERERGLLLAQGGQGDRALPFLRSTLKEDLFDLRAVTALGQAALAAHRPTEAMPTVEKFISLHPEEFSVRILLADLRLADGDADGAAEALRAAPASDARDDALVDLYERTNRLDKASALLAGLQRSGQAETDRLRRLARLARWRQSGPDELLALSGLEKAGLATPAEAERRLDVALYAGDWDGALAAADAIESRTDSTRESLRLARRLRERARDIEGWRTAAVRVAGRPDAEAADAAELFRAEARTKRRAEAKTVLANLLSRWPADAEAIRLCLAEASALEWTAESSLAALHLAERLRRADDWRTAAIWMEKDGRAAEARKLLDESGGGVDGQAESVWLSGTWALRDGDRATASARAKTLARAAASPDEAVETGGRALDLFAGLGEREEAVRLAEILLARNPLPGPVLLEIAASLTNAGLPGKALPAIDRARASGAAPAAVRLAEAQARLALAWRLPEEDPARPAAARAAIDAIRASRADAPDADLTAGLAGMLIALGNLDEAIAELKSAPVLTPDLRLDAAEALAEANRGGEAGAWIAPLTTDGLDAFRLARFAGIRSRLGEHEAALALLQRASAAAPRDAGIRLLLADAAQRAGNRALEYEAIDAHAALLGEEGWVEAVERRIGYGDGAGEDEVLARGKIALPGSRRLQARRIARLAALDRREEALAEYESWRKERPAAGKDELEPVARALLALGRPDEAEELFRDALRRDPEAWPPALGLARIAAARRRFAAAENIFRGYLTAYPNDGWVWYELAETLARAGRPGAAEDARALATLPSTTEPAALGARARLLVRAKRFAEAEALLAKAHAADRAAADPACDYADFLLDRDRKADAGVVLANLPSDTTRPRILRTRARLLIDEGRPTKALRLLSPLVGSKDRDSLSALAYATEAAGDWRGAVRLHEQAAAAY